MEIIRTIGEHVAEIGLLLKSVELAVGLARVVRRRRAARREDLGS